jgi:hypothetical protein
MAQSSLTLAETDLGLALMSEKHGVEYVEGTCGCLCHMPPPRTEEDEKEQASPWTRDVDTLSPCKCIPQHLQGSAPQGTPVVLCTVRRKVGQIAATKVMLAQWESSQAGSNQVCSYTLASVCVHAAGLRSDLSVGDGLCLEQCTRLIPSPCAFYTCAACRLVWGPKDGDAVPGSTPGHCFSVFSS